MSAGEIATETAPGGGDAVRECPYLFRVQRAALKDSGTGLRLVATERATGRAWRHQTVLPDSEAGHARLLLLALEAGKAWALSGWAPGGPNWA